MKNITIIIFSFIVTQLFSQIDTNQNKYGVFDNKKILLFLGLEWQFSNINLNHEQIEWYEFKSYRDDYEALNTQFITYDFQIRLYKNFFMNIGQGFAYDHLAYKEMTNMSNATIYYDDIKGWYIKNRISVNYYFHFNKNIFDISLGTQRTTSPVYMVFLQKSGNDYFSMTANTVYHRSDFFELKIMKSKMQMGIGYNFNNMTQNNEGNFNSYYIKFSYNIKGW